MDSASTGGGHIYHLYSTSTAAGQGAGYFTITDETAPWADRLVINPSGNVGIGTDTPSNRLDISGGLGVTTTTSTVPTNGIYSPSANKLAITTNGAAAVGITSTGAVGIGTTSSAVSLDLSGRTDAVAVPSGTTAQRPGSPVNGQIYNTTLNLLEAYVNGSWKHYDERRNGQYSPS